MTTDSNYLSLLFISLLLVILIFFVVIESHAPHVSPEFQSISFNKNNIRTTISIESIEPDINQVFIQRSIADSVLSTHSAILPYALYQFQVGDIDGDRNTDLCLGVIKACRFDDNIRKRLFIYGIDEGYLVPLWLGTYLGDELINFRLMEFSHKTLIRSLEIDKDDNYLVKHYQWLNFGPEFLDVVYNGGNYEQAMAVFETN